MIRLLSAGFERLKKNKIFWLLTIFSIGLALIMICIQYSDMKRYDSIIKVEQLLLNYSTMVGIVIAVFTSLFLGVEYSDGAIRNKISIGHKRLNIYLSNLIIVIITSLFSYILFMVLISIIGIPLFGGITMSKLTLLTMIGCIFITIIAYSSIFTFIASVISNKTIIAIISIMFSFGMIMFALACLNTIQEPEFVMAAHITNKEDGSIEMIEEPNPRYPSEKKKKFYQMLLDINPAGQMIQLAGRTAPNLKILPIYSLGIIVIFTGAGLVLFKKKELK